MFIPQQPRRFGNSQGTGAVKSCPPGYTKNASGNCVRLVETGPVSTSTNPVSTQTPVCPPGYAVNDAGVCAPVTTPPPAAGTPVITSLSANSGAPGAEISVRGQNLGTRASPAEVTIDGEPVGSLSGSGIAAYPDPTNGLLFTFFVPPGIASGQTTIDVQLPSGAATSIPFTVTGGAVSHPTPPTINSVSPTEGAPGTIVTIIGSGLTGATAAIGGEAAVLYGTASDSQISIVIPSVAAGNQTLTLKSATGSAAHAFLVDPVPTSGDLQITSVNPASAAPGSMITVSGSGLAGATSASVGGATATITPVSDTMLMLQVPAGAVGSGLTIFAGAQAEPFSGFTVLGSTVTGTCPPGYVYDPTTGGCDPIGSVGAGGGSTGGVGASACPYGTDSYGNCLPSPAGQPIVAAPVSAGTIFGFPWWMWVIGAGAAFVLFEEHEKKALPAPAST